MGGGFSHAGVSVNSAEKRNLSVKGKNGIVDFSRARVSRKKVSPGRYGGNIAIFFGLVVNHRWF